MNDELNEEIGELKKELEKYSNKSDKLYSSDNTKSQKTIEELKQKTDIVKKEKKELEQKLNILEKEKTSCSTYFSKRIS